MNPPPKYNDYAIEFLTASGRVGYTTEFGMTLQDAAGKFHAMYPTFILTAVSLISKPNNVVRSV